MARIRSSYVDRSGQRHDYESRLLRRTYRADGKVKHETLANLSALPEVAVAALERVLRGQSLVPADTAVEVTRSLPHGHVAAVWTAARALGLPSLLGPPGRMRDLALALLVARVVRPASKLATSRWWVDTTLAADLGVADASRDEVYAALDWLAERQEAIEAELARRHLGPGALALFDLSSSWVTGTQPPLAAFGYSRDARRDYPQITYGLLTDAAGRPVAVRVYPGNTADPTAFAELPGLLAERFGLSEVVVVGDRGMLTAARIAALREPGGFGWISALRAPAVAALAADTGPLQLSLFDETDLAEISHPDYPGERLVACRNPALAEHRAAKRSELLAATETALGRIAAAVAAGRLVDPVKIALRVGRVRGKYRMAKHFGCDIGPGRFTFARDQAAIAAEAALDGIYVLRTSVPAGRLPAGEVVRAYKNLANVERDFRSLKTVDLELRPIHHYTESRVRAHVFLCALAAYLTWQLRSALAPLTFTDEAPAPAANPVAPARRSSAAAAKAATKRTAEGSPAYSFRGLLDHLGTLTRNSLRFGGVDPAVTVEQLSLPTPIQRRAFELLGGSAPVQLK